MAQDSRSVYIFVENMIYFIAETITRYGPGYSAIVKSTPNNLQIITMIIWCANVIIKYNLNIENYKYIFDKNMLEYLELWDTVTMSPCDIYIHTHDNTFFFPDLQTFIQFPNKRKKSLECMNELINSMLKHEATLYCKIW